MEGNVPAKLSLLENNGRTAFTVAIDCATLLESLSDDDRASLIESLACHERIVEAVVDQLADGFTSAGSYSFATTLQAGRIRLMEKMADVQFRAVKHAMWEAACAEESRRLTEVEMAAWRTWARDSRLNGPVGALRSWSAKYPNDSEVRAKIAESDAAVSS